MKAFDAINRESFGLSLRYMVSQTNCMVRIGELLYESFKGAVLENREDSDYFLVTTGVKRSVASSLGFCF